MTISQPVRRRTRARRLLGSVFGCAAGFAAIGLALAWWALGASRVERTGKLSVAGLEHPVEIHFDARARPYVRAATQGDAFFAQGVLHARERLWQMELLSRAGRGRLSEILGRPLLETDRELWRMGVPQLAARLAANATDEAKRLVSRYVDGVNAALADLRVRPPELLLAQIPIREWSAADVFALGAAMAFSSARNADNEILRLALSETLSEAEFAAFLPDESSLPGFRYIVRGLDLRHTMSRREALVALDQPLLPSLSLGSNGWAVAPSRSRSGHALFAFDSHDSLALPNLHYEIHMFFGDRAIRGFSIPGLPGVINGFNDRIAWGFTNIGDSQDLFLEQRHPDDRERFLGPDGWYEARIEEVAIPVRFEEPAVLRIVHTRNGPLIEDDPPLALAWSGHHVRGEGLDALFALNLASNWTEASAALDRLPAPSANATYADVAGHVAFRTVGLLPARGRGDGLFPLPGHEAANGWRGLLPAAELPRVVDPAAGFVAAANARVNPPGVGPLISADNAPGYRIARIQSVLAASDAHSAQGMQALQMDWYNGQAARLLPALLRQLGGGDLGPGPNAARATLATWQSDPDNAPEARAPLIFLRWYLAIAEELFAERLGDEIWPRLLSRSYVLNHAVDGLIVARTDAAPWWHGDRDGLIRRAFIAAVSGLEADFGKDHATWRWDAWHQVHFSHELAQAAPPLRPWLDRGPYPWGGDHASVGRARYRYQRPDRVTTAATMRLVIEMSNPMRAFAILPGGQAGHPSDPHYDDQITAWLQGELDPLAATPEEVSGATLRLEPR